MRTFHIGGTAQVAEQSFFESRHRRRGRSSPARPSRPPTAALIVMSRNTQVDRSRSMARTANPTSRPTARACGSRTATRSSAASASPNGTPTPPRSSPKWAARCASRTWSRPLRSARRPTRPPASPTAWSSTGAPAPRGSDLRPAMAVLDDDGAYKKLANGGDARYLLPVGRHSVGRRRRRGQAGRRARPYPDRKRQDPRHHRRSAAGGRTVRSPPSEGLRGHRRDGRPGRVRHGLQEQAPDQDHPGRTAARPVEFLIPKGKHIAVHDGDIDPQGRVHHRRQPGSARHPAHPGHRGAGRLPGQRDPGGLPTAGRADQRQAHRDDRSSDAAEGRDPRAGRHRPDQGRPPRQARVRRRERQGRGPRRPPGHHPAGAARHHQGVAADPLLHLGGLVPGDHPRAHRRLGARQDRHPGRPEGERHRRPADPGGHGLLPARPAAHRRQARRAADASSAKRPWSRCRWRSRKPRTKKRRTETALPEAGSDSGPFRFQDRVAGADPWPRVGTL